MSDYIIKVENLGKKYTIQHEQPERYLALRDLIARGAMAPVRWLRRQHGAWSNGNGANPHSEKLPAPGSLPPATEDFWALRDVSFEVKQGEVLGIIGRNGAGKSTLLKILSRITEPTAGRVRIRGRVASLLEVGTGFHPELTGRENIFVNGAILGMTRVEVKRKFDEIVAFAEVEEFLDTPVKRYSSGMFVRLAFAVAAHLEPEILVVDEVLAVGDAAFQKRCLGKMGEVARKGRTVLFVSHNMAAVSNLCTKAIILERGKLRFQGLTDDALTEYMQASFDKSGWNDNRVQGHRPSWAEPCITSARVLGSQNQEQMSFPLCADVTFEMTFQSPNGRTVRSPAMGVVINHAVFGTVGNVNTWMTGFKPDRKQYLSATMRCTLKRLPFLQGLYTVDLWLGDGAENIDTLAGCLSFSIEATDVYGTGNPPVAHMGVVVLDATWDVCAGGNHENAARCRHSTKEGKP